MFGVEDAVAEDVVTVSLWDIGMRSVESPARGLDGAHMNPCGALGWGIYHFIEKNSTANICHTRDGERTV